MNKNDLIEPIVKLRFKLDRLSQRDRAMVLGVSLGLIFLCWYYLFYGPQSFQINATQLAINNVQTETATLNDKRAMVESMSKDVTFSQLLDKYKSLQVRMTQLEAKITRYQKRFIDNKQLAYLLTSILKQIHDVSIIGFSNEEITEDPNDSKKNASSPATSGNVAPTPENISASVTPEGNTTASSIPAEQKPPPVQKIQYTLTLKGQYFSIMSYLKKLENTEWQFYWDKFNYKVEKHPDATATIEFYTLRPSKSAEVHLLQGGP